MKYIRDILLFLALLILDQLAKFYFLSKSFNFNYFSFSFVPNTGISFGLFSGRNFIFIFFITLVIGFIIYYYFIYKKYRLAFVFILAGAIGNLIDRIFRGFVVDFINLKIWPVFNLADLFVCIGVLLLIYYLIKEKA